VSRPIHWSLLVVLGLLLAAMSLAGCLSGDSDGEDPEPGPGETREAPSPGRIAGSVTGHGGALEEARVEVRFEGAVLTDTNGGFAFDEVAPGEHRITITKEYYQRQTLNVDVEPGEEVILEVELQLRMLTPQVPLKYATTVTFVNQEDILLASSLLPVGGPAVTLTNETKNNTFPGFWEIETEPGWLVAQLDVIIAWGEVTETQPDTLLGVRYFRGEDAVSNELVEEQMSEHHSPDPMIDRPMMRYYQITNEDWLTWGDRTWQVGIVAEETEELPGGAGTLHVVQIVGLLVAEEYAQTL
jgi:hypothetical protein